MRIMDPSNAEKNVCFLSFLTEVEKEHLGNINNFKIVRFVYFPFISSDYQD